MPINVDLYKYDLQNRFPDYIFQENVKGSIKAFNVFFGNKLQASQPTTDLGESVYAVRRKLLGTNDIAPLLTTAQRDAISTPIVVGQQILNITTGNIEVFNGSTWVQATDISALQPKLQPITLVTEDSYTVQPEDVFIGVDNGSDPIITLPTSELIDGRDIIIMDTGGNISALNTLTVDTEGSEDINGSNSITGITDYVSFRLRSDGSNWFSY